MTHPPLGLREAQNQVAFAQSFSGQHRHLLDFFKEEVLSGLLPGLRDFIVKTSILDRFNAELCDAVLERNDGATVLEELGRSDMFVVPLDGMDHWYRYQALFRDVASQYLDTVSPEVVRHLHERASIWYEQKGLIEESASHSVKAGNWERVVSLIEPIAKGLLFSNKVGQLQSWILRLPLPALSNAPYLSLWLARALMAGNLRADLEYYLAGAERLAREQNDPVLMGAILSARAHRCSYRGATAEAIEIAQLSLDTLPADEKFYRAIAERVIGVSQLLMDRPREAEEQFSVAIILSTETQNTNTACASMALRASALGRMGMIRDGLAEIENARRLCLENLELLVVQIPFIQSRLLYEAWEIDRAIAVMADFDDLCVETGYRIFSANGHYMMALLEWARGNFEAIEPHLETARTQTLSFGAVHEVYSSNTVIMRMRLADGNWDSVNVWERSEEHEGHAGAGYERLAILERIRLWRAVNSGDRPWAEYHLERLRALEREARQAGRNTDVVDSWVGQATALYYLGDVQLALSSLGAAIAIAEPLGLLRPFFEEGPRIRPLLEEAAKRGLFPSFLPVIGRVSKTNNIEISAITLSERETEILRLLSLGYQNHEIADHVVLSENTIKTHLKNVYSKLGIRNRTQAVARGRELKLVP